MEKDTKTTLTPEQQVLLQMRSLPEQKGLEQNTKQTEVKEELIPLKYQTKKRTARQRPARPMHPEDSIIVIDSDPESEPEVFYVCCVKKINRK